MIKVVHHRAAGQVQVCELSQAKFFYRPRIRRTLHEQSHTFLHQSDYSKAIILGGYLHWAGKWWALTVKGLQLSAPQVVWMRWAGEREQWNLLQLELSLPVKPGFYLIVLFHSSDCPHTRGAFGFSSNHFPIMQMISPKKSATLGAHQFSQARSFECRHHLPNTPPTSYAWKEGLFLMRSSVFALPWNGNREGSRSINLYNPLKNLGVFFSIARNEIIQMYGEYCQKKWDALI